jgi:intracellular septation protein A
VLGKGLRARQVVLRHVVPRLVEATVIPSAIFYVMWRTVGTWPALMAALAWSGVVIVRRVLRTGRVPALVLIASLGLGARTLVSILSGSTFVYFLQPALVTAAIAATFLVSLATGRPLVRRLAAEFCPLSDADSARHGVQRLFRGLTLLWGLVLLANAVVTLVVLLTVSINTFVVIKSLVTPGLTCAAALFTIVWAVRVARREGLSPSRGAAALSF